MNYSVEMYRKLCHVVRLKGTAVAFPCLDTNSLLRKLRRGAMAYSYPENHSGNDLLKSATLECEALPFSNQFLSKIRSKHEKCLQTCFFHVSYFVYNQSCLDL